MSETALTLPDDLSEGEKALIKRLQRKPLEVYWGASGWRSNYLPKPAKRADFDKLLGTRFIAEVTLGRMVICQEYSESPIP